MTQPLGSRLARIAPGEAALLTRLAEAGAGLRVAPSRRAASAWIAFAAEPAGWTMRIAPLTAGDAPLRLTADDGRPDALRAATAMEAVEPIIAAIEHAFGQALRPIGLSADAPDRPSLLVEGADTALLISIEAAGVVHPFIATAPSAARVAALPGRVAWRIAGPSLAPDTIAALGIGDMLLVPAVSDADLICGEMRWAARADLTAGTLTIDHSGSRTLPADTEAWTQVRMPVDLVIDGGAVTVGRLAALAPGSVLELDTRGDVLPVELRSGGAVIGRGELVAVGDGFGVILTEVSAQPATAPEAAPAPAAEPADA